MKLKSKKYLPLVIFAAILGLAMTAGFLFYIYEQSLHKSNNVTADSSSENKQLVDEVSRFIVLPDEEPTIATISDINKLKDQPFFQKAKNGDKVLIYTNAKKAYLFDPVDKKIVDVASFNVSSPSASLAEASAAPQKDDVKIVVRNGTNVQGLASKMAKQVQDLLPQSTILSKENASKLDYNKSTIIILNSSGQSAADKLSQSLSIAKGNLPPGETKPDGADILIIFGQDKSH